MIAERPPRLRVPSTPLPTDEELQREARLRHEDGERALLSMRLREWRVPALDREALLRGDEPEHPTPALHHVRRFHQEGTDWALVLWGGYRVGKTYAAIRWLVEAARAQMVTLDHGRTYRYATSARFIPFADLADAAGSYRHHHQDLVAEAITAHALVLDDVGAQLAAGASILDQVVCTRHLQQRPTLLTTNLGRDLFARPDRYGLRATLRLEERGSFHACGGDGERLALQSALGAA